MSDSLEEEDEDLKRAIQLSLQTDQPGVKAKCNGKKEVINLESDDESTTDDAPDEIKDHDQATARPTPVPSMGILGLDRKTMEQERLARKRKASISPPPARKAAKTSEHRSSASIDRPLDDHVLSGTPSAQQRKLSFPQGAFKKTWALGYPREDDIKIEEVLQKNDLSLAVLSSFQWDVEWLLRKMNITTTQLVFVMQADDDEVKSQYRRETADMKNLRFCFPSMEGQVHCMHSKLMLLSYPTHLRVVVPTANLVPYDWGETGIMENMVFLVDLPRLPADHATHIDGMTQFGKDLIYFLKTMGLDQSIINSIYHFDFSATQDLAFVHTIGGGHVGQNDPWRRTGYCGLGRAISQLGLDVQEPLLVDYITSSLGSLNVDFLLMLYLAAQGDDGLTEYESRYTKQKKAFKLTPVPTSLKGRLRRDIDAGFRVYFPTEHTVKASKGGPDNGGTICFQRRWWHSDTFPRKVMRDCKSRREGMLMHNKVFYPPTVILLTLISHVLQLLFVQPQQANLTPQNSPSDSKAWVYIGSANCTESAWGKLVKDRKENKPKLNCRNWECGVVVPLRRVTASRRDGSTAKPSEQGGLGPFEGLIPVPMTYPGEEYGGKIPWFFDDQYVIF